jgi:tRNA pseudouridine55 synthase
MSRHPTDTLCGILPVHKMSGTTSFRLVSLLRKRTLIDTIGHAGTLDPFATGVMVMLIGRSYTRLSSQFLLADKEYLANVHLGQATDTFDIDGQVVSQSDHVPSLSDVEKALCSFQGSLLQTPPMFSAKKINGQKLYHLARKGIIIDRPAQHVRLHTILISYKYPDVRLMIECSKGTYIRSVAHDLGQMLGCGAYLSVLTRTRTAGFSLADCIEQNAITDPLFNLAPHLRRNL